MRRYSTVTQEMANEFPPNSRIHQNEQSLGQRVLNAFAPHLEDFEQEWIRVSKNVFPNTANLDEIDWLYKVELDNTFSFDLDTTDPFLPSENIPVASGAIGSNTYVITNSDFNDLESFWYDAVPTRISSGVMVSGNSLILDSYTHLAPHSGIILEPYHSTKLYATVQGGVGYIQLNDKNQLERGKIIIHGTTRKGTPESETIVFPWDMTQPSFKEWESIGKVECLYLPSGVIVQLRADNYNNGPYIDFWNTTFNQDREKVDTFWNLASNSYGSVLDWEMYSTGDATELIGGLYDIYAERRFELLNESSNNITALDIAQQPFSNYIWAVSSNKLYCYDSHLTTVDNTTPLRSISDDVNIQLELDFQHGVRGDEIGVECFIREISNPVVRYQIWVEYPNGVNSGIIDGALTTYTANNYTSQDLNIRQVDRPFTFIPDQLGEHVFNVKAVLASGKEEQNVKILCVDSKTPEAEFSLPAGVTATGLAFDSDQDLWVSTASGYVPINFAYDHMLIDYDNKTIYFRENYDQVYISDV